MNRKGNILLPIISAIAVLALAAAGYFFWQNQQYKNQFGHSTPPPITQGNATPVPTTHAQTNNWKTYTNNELNFSLKYPNDWDKLEESHYVRFFKGKYSPTLPMPETYISVQVKEKGNISVKSWLLSQGLLPTATNTQSHISVQDITVNGVMGVRISAPVNGGQDTIYLPSGMNVLQITYIFKGSEVEDYQKLIEIFDQIVSTFKFVDTNNEASTELVRGDLYPKPATWRIVDLLTPDLKVCLPPKWKAEPEGSGHIIFDRDPAYKPDVVWISRLPYFGGSRREEYINLKTQYEPDLKSKVSVKELTINSKSILDISIYSMPEALVFADSGTLIEIQLSSWNLVNDSRTEFLKDIYTMVGCIR